MAELSIFSTLFDPGVITPRVVYQVSILRVSTNYISLRFLLSFLLMLRSLLFSLLSFLYCFSLSLSIFLVTLLFFLFLYRFFNSSHGPSYSKPSYTYVYRSSLRRFWPLTTPYDRTYLTSLGRLSTGVPTPESPRCCFLQRVRKPSLPSFLQ
jgi:hypothetical protein